MVKKRQADLDIGSLPLKGQLKTTVSLRQHQGKVTKKKNTGAQRNINQFASAARDLLFGGKKSKRKSSKIIGPTETDGKEEKPFDLQTVKRLSRSPKNLKSRVVTTDTRKKEKSKPRNPGTALFSPDKERPKTRSSSSITSLNAKKRPKDKDLRSPSPLNWQSKSTGKSPQTDRTTDLPTDSDPTTAQTQRMKTKKVKSHTSIQSALKTLAAPSNSPNGITRPTLVSPEPMEDDTTLERVQKMWKVGENSWIVVFNKKVEIRGMFRISKLSNCGHLRIHGQDISSPKVQEIHSPSGYHHAMLECMIQAQEQTSLLPLSDIPTVCSGIDEALHTEIDDFLSENVACMAVWFEEYIRDSLKLCFESAPYTISQPPGYMKLPGNLVISDCELSNSYGHTTLEAVDYLLKQTLKKKEQTRIIIVGDKNMGKSTFIRYITNQLLNEKLMVLHLDCDPGQGEFAPPGSLSLHRTVQPLQGPPWCRVPDSVDNIEFYGALSADIEPDRYMKCIRNLVSKAHKTSDPLLVNTMGWKQGLGLQFLSGTIALVRPTHVIQLSTEEESYKNFSELTVFNVGSHDLFIPKEKLPTLHTDCNYELMPLIMKHTSITPGFEVERINPALLRDLMMTAYMSKFSTTSEAIYEMVPYRVGLPDVAVYTGALALPCHMTLRAINMAMVALCSAPKEKLKPTPDADHLTLTDTEQLSVIGYGLVRAVDPHNKCLYITTPVSQSPGASQGTLDEINVIYKLNGNMTPERWIFNQISKVKDDEGIPYVSRKKGGLGFVSTSSAKYAYRKGRKTAG